jgi:spore maturation protein CgeB
VSINSLTHRLIDSYTHNLSVTNYNIFLSKTDKKKSGKKLKAYQMIDEADVGERDVKKNYLLTKSLYLANIPNKKI